MDSSSLPRYPRSESSTGPIAGTAGRGWWLLLQFVTIIAFWVGIFLVREKARGFSEAHRRAEERAKVEDAKKAIMGLWRSTQLSSVEMELRNGKYSLLRNGTVWNEGEYIWSINRLKLLPRWSLHCWHDGDELVLWDDGKWSRESYGDWFLLQNMLGREAALRVFAEEKVLRFRRVSK